MTPPLITAEQLMALRAQHQDVLVADCTFHLNDVHLGRQQYEQSHIAGAVYVDLDQDLSAHDPAESVNGGRHPLPTREVMAQRLGRLGIGPQTIVVTYDQVGTLVAGRLWWLLRWCGHAHTYVLDGGWEAWRRAAGDCASGVQTRSPAPAYPLAPPLENLVLQAEVINQLDQPAFHLVDARAAARYRGEVEPIDRVAGHIPGAMNRPYDHNFNADGTFKDAQTLRKEWSALLPSGGDRPVVAYCGSGVSAIPNLIALSLAGIEAHGLYAGSWSEWSSNPSLPVATHTGDGSESPK